MNKLSQIKYYSGFLFNYKIPSILFPTEIIFILLDDILNKKNNLDFDIFKKEIKQIIKKDLENIFYNFYNQKDSTTNNICLFIKYLNNIGLGHSNLNYFNQKENEIYFSLDSSKLNSNYKKFSSHKNTKFKYFEYFLIYYLEYYIKFYFKKEIESTIRRKNNMFYLKIKIISENKFNFNKIKIKNNFSNINNFFNLSKNKTNLDINLNQIKESHIKINKGEFKLWGANGILFSQLFFYNFVVFLEKYKLENYLYKLAKIQAIISIDIKRKKFGLKDKNQILKSIFLNSKILGYGLIKTNKNINSENSINKLSISLNSYSKSKKLFLKNNINSKDKFESIINKYYITMMQIIIKHLFNDEFNLIKKDEGNLFLEYGIIKNNSNMNIKSSNYSKELNCKINSYNNLKNNNIKQNKNTLYEEYSNYISLKKRFLS